MAYSEISLSTEHVHLREESADPGTLAAIHERLWLRDAAIGNNRTLSGDIEPRGEEIAPTVARMPPRAA